MNHKLLRTMLESVKSRVDEALSKLGGDPDDHLTALVRARDVCVAGQLLEPMLDSEIASVFETERVLKECDDGQG